MNSTVNEHYLMNLAVPKERQELSLKVKLQLAECAAKLRAQWETEKVHCPRNGTQEGAFTSIPDLSGGI